MSSFPIIDGRSLDDGTTAAGLVLLDFWQTSCAPCRSLEPRLERFGTAHADHFTGYRIAQSAVESAGRGTRPQEPHQHSQGPPRVDVDGAGGAGVGGGDRHGDPGRGPPRVDVDGVGGAGVGGGDRHGDPGRVGRGQTSDWVSGRNRPARGEGSAPQWAASLSNLVIGWS